MLIMVRLSVLLRMSPFWQWQGSIRLVAGNTGYGIYKEWLPEDHLIDIKQVPELRHLSLSKVRPAEAKIFVRTCHSGLRDGRCCTAFIACATCCPAVSILTALLQVVLSPNDDWRDGL